MENQFKVQTVNKNQKLIRASVNRWLHLRCRTTRWRKHRLSGVFCVRLRFFRRATHVSTEADPAQAALSRYGLTSPARLHSCTPFLVNSYHAAFRYLRYCQNTLILQIPNQEFLNYYKTLRGKNNLYFLFLISWTFSPNDMQFTTYIDLVIFPWGYQTENVKERQCGVMERKKDKGIDSCAVQ